MLIRDRKLLVRIADYYQHTLTAESPEQEFLADQGINIRTIKNLHVGFSNGTLKDILPDEPDIIKKLKQLGILDNKGTETLNDCIVLPLFDKDGIISLCGINTDSGEELYLRESGIINRQAVKRSSSILLTASVIDALLLYDQGFKNVVPINDGTLTRELLALFSGRVKDIYICFGGDTANYITEQLQKKKHTVHPVTLPDKDIHTFFNRRTPEEFEELLKETNPASIEQSDTLNKRKQTLYRLEEHGFTVGYAKRQYQVKGIQRGDTQLKATIKVSEDVLKNKPFELTTIDLYSSRSRHWFSKLCAGLFGEPEALTKEDISRLLQLVEDWQPVERDNKPIEISKADKELALSFLKNEDIFDELLEDFDTLVVTGEEVNKLVGYLAATSRKLEEPLSVLIQSRSAAGKSTMQDAILQLIPPEDFVQYTRVTDQALFYKEENSLVHKILAIEEAEGMGGAAYSIRNIQTARKITVAVTGKDHGTGKMKTEEYTVRGPVCVMVTTTQNDIDQEIASRFIFLTIDESQEMTEAIHEKQREGETLEGLINQKKQQTIIAKHYAVQRLLKPLAVVNPYSKYLRFPNQSLRSRRDHKKYLGLIRSVAYLHQYQREIKTVKIDTEPVEYIEVDIKDIELANQLANEVLGQSLDELSKPSRILLSSIFSMIKGRCGEDEQLEDITFTRRQVREYTSWTDWQVRTHIKQLVELEYINARIGSHGREYSYALHYQGQGEEKDKCYLDLTSVDEIERLLVNSEDK